MVYYSNKSKDDLKIILWGLANWKKHPLGYNHAVSYVSDIRKEADTICTKLFHQNCIYKQHLNYGEKIHTYKRNTHTQWYIIYDWDAVNRVAYVLKILNNHLTYSTEI
jgi:hypothetical protein